MSVPRGFLWEQYQTVSCTDSTWARRKRWKDNGAWSWDVKVLDADVLLAATDRCGYFAGPRSLALTSLAGYSPSHHSLGPYPYGNCLPALPPQEHAASPLCKLLGYSKRSFSSWTSTSHVDVGTEQKMCFLKLRRWWLHDCSWRRRAWHLGPEHGRLHMTIRGNRVPSFSVTKERQAVAFTAVAPTSTERASDLLLEQTRISISSWKPGPRRGTPGAIQNVQGDGTSFPYKSQWNTFNVITSRGSVA